MFQASELNHRDRRVQRLYQALFLSMTVLLILPVAVIFGTLIYKGGPIVSFDFLFSYPVDGMTAGGIFPALLGTVWLVAVALLFSVPLGIAAALYLSEYAPDNWFTRLINLCIINLAGVPSIVHALQGIFDQTMALSLHLFVVSTQVPGVPEALPYGVALVLIAMVLLMNSLSIALRVYLRGKKKW